MERKTWGEGDVDRRESLSREYAPPAVKRHVDPRPCCDMVSSVDGLASAAAVIGGSVRPLRSIGDNVAQSRKVARHGRDEHYSLAIPL
jgi:hypothetical protein